MKTPNHINGIRTEAIMKRLTSELFSGMPTDRYNEMYTIIYETLKKISIKNLYQCLKEDIKFFDRKYLGKSNNYQPNANDQFDQRVK